jgi:hypothetical protein
VQLLALSTPMVLICVEIERQRGLGPLAVVQQMVHGHQ